VTVKLRRTRKVGVVLLAVLGPPALLGLQFTDWSFRFVLSGLLGLVMLIWVIRVAVLDRAEALKPEAGARSVAESIGLGLAKPKPEAPSVAETLGLGPPKPKEEAPTPSVAQTLGLGPPKPTEAPTPAVLDPQQAPTEQAPTEATPHILPASSGPVPPPPKPTSGRGRRRQLVAMALIFAGVVGTLFVWAITHQHAGCGASSLGVLIDGPRIQIPDIPGRRGDVYLARVRLEAACRTEAMADLVDAANVLLLGAAVAIFSIVDLRSKKPKIWAKLPWFALLAVLASPPVSSNVNLMLAGAGLAVGGLVLAIVKSRTRLGPKGAKLALPYRRIVFWTLAISALGATGVGLNQVRLAADCRQAEKQTLLPKTQPLEKVVRSVSGLDRLAIQDSAAGYFVKVVAENPSAVDPDEVKVRLEKIVLKGDQGYGLFTYRDNLQTIRGLGVVLRRPKGWTVTDIETSPLWVEGDFTGSQTFVFLQHNGAVGGYIDPSATRVESVDHCGAVTDRDVPTDGATIVLVPASGQIRGFSGSTVMTAVPIVAELTTAPSVPADARAQKVAGRFVDLLLKKGWQQSLPLVAGQKPEAWVRPFGALVTGRYKVTGPPVRASRGFLFPMVGPGGVSTLVVTTVDDGSGKNWRVNAAFLQLGDLGLGAPSGGSGTGSTGLQQA
jgi:hypothetical protein